MKIWTIYRAAYRNGISGPLILYELGNVRAKHNPHALLRAFKKYGIRDNATQRCIVARPKGTRMMYPIAKEEGA